MIGNHTSWKPMYRHDNSRDWISSAQRFATHAEAIQQAREMMLNAGAMTSVAIETSDPINSKYTDHGAESINVGP